MQVTVLHHLDMPLTRQNSFNLAPGTENEIAVTPALTTTTKSAISRLTSEERDCYTEDEISLKYLPVEDGFRYGMDNCLFIAAFEQILEECKCYPGFNGNLISSKSSDFEFNISPCIGKNLTCMNDILYRVGSNQYVDANGRKMKCRSSCEDQVNKLFVSTSSYPNSNTFRYREEFCLILDRILNKCKRVKRKSLEQRYPNICTKVKVLQDLNPNQFCFNNQWDPSGSGIKNCTEKGCYDIEQTVYQYARENLIKIHVSIKDPYVKKFKKDEKMPIISYIANLGGLLGFVLGSSIITGIEVLYHILSGILSIFKKKPTGDELNKHKKRRSTTVRNLAKDNENLGPIEYLGIEYCKTLNISI